LTRKPAAGKPNRNEAMKNTNCNKKKKKKKPRALYRDVNVRNKWVTNTKDKKKYNTMTETVTRPGAGYGRVKRRDNLGTVAHWGGCSAPE